jgi:hypothetical protein
MAAADTFRTDKVNSYIPNSLSSLLDTVNTINTRLELFAKAFKIALPDLEVLNQQDGGKDGERDERQGERQGERRVMREEDEDEHNGTMHASNSVHHDEVINNQP